MPAYEVTFRPSDSGQKKASQTVVRGAVKPEGVAIDCRLNPTSAQYQGIMGYIGLINAGVDTSTVQSAITALTP